MSNALKCPNPSCPYLFDPSRVPAGVVLSCPRCGMKFTLGPPAPHVAPAPAPGPSGFEDLTAPAPRAQQPNRPVTRRPPPGHASSRFQAAILYGIGAVLLAGTATAVYFKLVRRGTPPPGETVNRLPDLNLTFDPPAKPWERDEEARVKLGAPYFLVFKRADPEAFAAFGAKDFETRVVRPSELREGLMRPLNKLFTNIKVEEVTGATWLGQPATAFGFRAQPRGGGPNVVGECQAVGYKGIGYWSVCWAAEADVKGQLAAFDAARGNFKLLGPREGWKAKESPVLPYRGDRLDYQLIDSEGAWKVADRKPEEEDPKADLFLACTAKKKGNDFAPEGTLLVYLLDGPGDPLAEARKYVEAEMNRDTESRGTNTFQELNGEPEGDPVSGTVEATAPVLRLRSTNDRAANYSWLHVLSAIRVDDKVVAAHARCRWADRAAFETKFVQLAGSLRPGK